MMNCENYREALAADPSFDGGAAHLGECASCQVYRTEMLEFEQKISRALTIDVPQLVMPELPNIETGNVVRLGSRKRITAPAWFAVAATVLLAAVLGVRMLSTDTQYDSLADEVLAHVDHEPIALRVTDAAVTDSRLQSVLSRDNAQVDRSAGLITYAQTCPINGHDVPHLVIQGEKGPVTILLMQHEHISEAVPLENEYFKGVILPVGNGSIAIIGGRDEALEEIEKSVVNSVVWKT